MSLHYLVTGGAGYIGSHLVLALVGAQHQATVLDDFSTGHRWATEGHEVIEVDIRDLAALRSALLHRHFDGVFHFAAKSLVGESGQKPLLYYQNNVTGTANLLEVALENDWRHCVFSSTAAVYGSPQSAVIAEEHPLNPVNVYGETKLAMEQLLSAVHKQGAMHAVCLRYFNAAGAAPDAHRGEWHEPETHLIPNVLRKAAGEARPLTIFGDDYDTPDGTCIRDYIHVLDLAQAHLKAMAMLHREGGFHTLNLGSEAGYSVREILRACETTVGQPITHDIGPRRQGDPPRLVADAGRAGQILGWRATRGLREIVDSAWLWEQERQRLQAR
ncbi:UDP-glucose 4-epimerase GalE [Luminiphilus sp. nBUS_16]|uniref:UDP-glucose 4-epimerase GalE n=1 Tax=Luminiphilus sp. nBUS_16 TaxID=3395315 RepID=UPI003EB6B310